MAEVLEIIHEYVTCEIGGTAGTDQPLSIDAGKDMSVELDGNESGSMHPKVKYVGNGRPVFGKLVSMTPNGKQLRVARRGHNMIYKSDATTNLDADVADANVGRGILGGTTVGTVKAGVAIGSRGEEERGEILGGTVENIRVSFP